MPKPQQQHGTAPKHGATVTTTESQYEAEQGLWNARRQKQEQSQARLMSALYPTAEDKTRRQGEIRAQEDACVAAREAERRRLASEAEAWQSRGSSPTPNQSCSSVAGVPCWSAATSAPTPAEMAREQYRQNALAATADNARLVEDRRRAKAEEAQREKELDRQQIISESTFFNLGAATGRFIPPEHKLLHKCATHLPLQPPPWTPAP